MTPVCDVPQYDSILRRQLFWCVHIQLASLFIRLTLSVQTNVTRDKYTYSRSTITFVDTHPGFIKIEARNTHSTEHTQSRTNIYIY
jgi:hypothetical protein